MSVQVSAVKPKDGRRRGGNAHRISVIGLGVGYALACVLARAGFQVVGVDVNPQVVAKPRRDKSLDILLNDETSKVIVEKNLRLTTTYGNIEGSEIIIICVSTGDEKKLVLGHVESAIESCLRVLRDAKNGPVLLVYSTLPAGSSKRIAEIFRKTRVQLDETVGYCHMPLMIAQGTTALDFVNPPFVVFGAYDKKVAERARTFYLSFIKKSILFNGRVPPNFVSSPEIAELAKLVANAFLTTKISFANMIARFCESQGLDGRELLKIVGSDWIIGEKMLKAGYAIGGACFPRDLRSLIETFGSAGVHAQILEGAHEVNEQRVRDPIDVLKHIKFKGKVLVAGLSYKAEVNDTRASGGLRLVEMLRSQGWTATGYDPNLTPSVKLSKVIDSDRPAGIIVTTREKQFESIGKLVRGTTVTTLLDYADIIDEKGISHEVKLFKAGRGWV